MKKQMNERKAIRKEKEKVKMTIEMNLTSLALNRCRHVKYMYVRFICCKELVPHN